MTGDDLKSSFWEERLTRSLVDIQTGNEVFGQNGQKSILDIPADNQR